MVSSLSSRLSPSTRQERLAELREFALRLLDEDRFLPWQIKSYCEHYVDSKWQLNKETKKEYVEYTVQELADIIVQQDKRRTSKTSV